MKQYICDICGELAPARSEAYDRNDVNTITIEHGASESRVRIQVDSGIGTVCKDLCRKHLLEVISNGVDMNTEFRR